MKEIKFILFQSITKRLSVIEDSYYCGGCSVGSSGPVVVDTVGLVGVVVGTVGLVGVVGPVVGGGIVPSTIKHSDLVILVGLWY